MKRTVWIMAAVGIVLLGFGACGSAAPESPDENTLFAANGPALTVVEKQPDQYTTDPEDKTVPPEQSPDLLTMNSQEEEGFALFYPLLSETQFRCLMDEDGVGVIELVLILVVLIGLVIVFKKQINTLLTNIFKQINSKSKEVY